MVLPKNVLADAISDALRNRNVVSAVFTTFSFDPGFFELHVLPLLFPNQNFSEAERVRLLQLDDCLRSLHNLAVYFDANALVYDADTPRLGYSRIDVHWRTGCFHPKLILFLVDDQNSEGHQSLIVCCQSANLTRAGWWENVECANIEEIRDKRVASSPCTIRSDLMSVLNRIRRSMPSDEHTALLAIHEFLAKRVAIAAEVHSSSGWRSRIFGGVGERNLPQWLNDDAKVPEGWNLEIVSPYFDQRSIEPIMRLIDTAKPKQTRIFLPQSADGTALVTPEVYDQVRELPKTRWAKLPATYTSRQGSQNVSNDRVAPRFVHAKVYRFWCRGDADLALIGSVNCTSAAHSRPGSGNLEVAILLDLADHGTSKRWWLEIDEEEVEDFVDSNPDEADGNDNALFALFIRYDWAVHEVAIRLREGERKRFPITVSNLLEETLFTIHSYERDDWNVCDEVAADGIRSALERSSFVNIACEGSQWRVLVREENCSHRPSLLRSLTPEEILKYWSLLSPEQRSEFLRIHVEDQIEGLPSADRTKSGMVDSVFSQFSGIFHAFGHFKRHIVECLTDSREMEAECRLFGAKYDSLPELLRKMLRAEDQDSVRLFITFLTARQLVEGLTVRFNAFFEEHDEMLQDLNLLIYEGLDIRDSVLPNQTDAGQEFLDWFEQMFLTELGG